MFAQQLLNSIAIGSVYALISMGATLIYGILGILDIANAGAYVLGAYLAAYLYALTGNIIIAFLGAIIITGFLGVVLQKTVYKPLLRHKSHIPLIASIGIFIFIENIIRLIAGPTIKKFNVVLPYDDIVIFNIYINNVWVLIFAVTLILLFLLWYILKKTKIGLAWRATAQDSNIAKSVGVNINKVIALNFFLGYSFAASAGILVGMLYNSINPSMGGVVSYKMLAIIVLGGLGNPFGTVLAALVIGLIETMIGGYIGFFIPRNAIAFVALVLILLITPKGLSFKKSKI
jgi:branched-chain amino acid transport system permease protein